MHLFVVLCTSFHEAWDMAQTFHVGDYLSESETKHQDMQLDVELFLFLEPKRRAIDGATRVRSWRAVR